MIKLSSSSPTLRFAKILNLGRNLFFFFSFLFSNESIETKEKIMVLSYFLLPIR